eukprot:420956-Amphidinium_carterae.1
MIVRTSCQGLWDHSVTWVDQWGCNPRWHAVLALTTGGFVDSKIAPMRFAFDLGGVALALSS